MGNSGLRNNRAYETGKPSTSHGNDLKKASGGATDGEDTKGARLSSKTVQKRSSEVVIENKTDKVLVLKEKIGAANGAVRYSIKAGSSVTIQLSRQITYYRLLVYAVVIEDGSTEDTGLTIDSDKLSDATHIVFSKDEEGKYIIS